MDSLYMYIPLIIALYILTKQVLNKTRNHPPSPFPTLPILGHLYLLKKPLHRTLSKVSARYGPILFLRCGSRPVLLVSSPSAAEECLSKNDVAFASRPRLVAGEHLGYNYTTLVWAPYGEHWRNLRRISATEIFSSNRIQLLSEIRSDEVKLMMKRLAETGIDHIVDMKMVLFELILNVLMRMIAGKRYYGENVAEVEAARRFREILEEALKLEDTTNVVDYLPIMRLFGVRESEKRLMALQEKRDRFMQDLIDERRSMGGGGERKKTMIEVLLSLQEEQPEYYTDEIVKGMMLVLLSAGSDTSTGTMEWALSLLLNNPEVLKKAQSEIDNLIGHHRLIEESDIPSLPYLRYIIYETLRLYPAGPLLPHESREESTVGGYCIPRGTMLLVNVWAIQNDPNVWADPRKFNPERFEGLKEGGVYGFKLIPFGFGRRGCPAEGLAMRIVGLALGSLIQCFDWERVSQDMVDMSEGAGLTLPKARHLMAKCGPRPAMAQVLSQI